MNKLIFITLIFCTLATACKTTTSSPTELLSENPILSAELIETDTSQFEQSWLIWFNQPIDHNHPEKGTFKQRIWYSHKGVDAPTVMVTEGYSAPRNYVSELTKLLNANQIIVEHRYFDQSKPAVDTWDYLRVDQAAKDHHEIIRFFKQLYKGKWLTTGISKGGQTAIFHRALFPEDVDISVPYVAPLNLQREDQRLFDFFGKVGTEDDRKRIHAFQKNVLEQKQTLLPLFEQYAKDKNYTFRMGIDKAFELAVLEYPFSFWQWGGSITDIPSSDASPEELFQHLKTGSDIGYVSDQSWEDIKPFFYQAYKELGYYAYVPGDLKALLTAFDQDTISSSIFAPGGDTLQFIPTMNDIVLSLEQNNPKMITIIGANDPWGATSINNPKLSNTIRAVSPEGSHKTRINNLPDDTREEVLNTLNEWLR